MGYEENADFLPLDELRDFLGNASAHDRVERGKRLIHEQQFRLQRHRLRDRDALALAAAQVARITISESGQAEAIEPFVRGLQGAAAIHAAKAEAERDIVACGTPRQQRVILEQDAKVGSDEFRFHLAGERLLQPNDDAQQAGLARAGGADETHELSRADLEAGALQNRLAPAVGE
jgi:hypothetical protein